MLKRVGFTIELACALFGVAGAAGLLWSPLSRMRVQEMVLVISFPAVSSLVLVAAAILFDLFPTPKLLFPINVVAPILHTAFLAVVMKLTLTTPSALQAVPQSLEPLAVWQNWQLLLACLLFEVSLLSGATSVVARNSRSPKKLGAEL